MRILGAQARLAWDSEVFVAVVGKGEEFEFIRLDQNGEWDKAAIAEAVGKDYALCGVLGVKDGVGWVRCQPNRDAVCTMGYVAFAFAREMNMDVVAPLVVEA